MKLRTILNRDLGADLRSIVGLLAGAGAIVKLIAEDLDKSGYVAGGGLTVAMILTVIGRWSKVGNDTR
jgi:hypothetical protein